MPVPSIITGKKSNNSITFAESKTVNQAAQDDAQVANVSDSPGASIVFTDHGAVAAGENIAHDAFAFADNQARGAFDLVGDNSRDAFDFADTLTQRALDTVNGVIDRTANETQDAIRASLATANIRSQLPSENLAKDNSDLFRVGLLAAAAVAVAFFVFGRG